MVGGADRRALIVGCGDVGCRLALRLIEAGIETIGLVRSSRSAAVLSRLGITPIVLDLDAGPATFAAALESCVNCDWLFYFAAPPNQSNGDPRVRNLLQALASPPRRLIYLSTSAVYGDCKGRWIDETAPLFPQSARGHRRLDAEHAVSDYAETGGCDALILRVPGIYGPGRLPVERLRAATPVLRAEDSPYTNRIHADDLANAALRIASNGLPGAYNVSDGSPTCMSDYFIRCARLLGIAEPAQVDRAEAERLLSPIQMSFLEESKRLRIDRVLGLGWQPKYADLDHGLRASLQADRVSEAFQAVHV